MIKVILKNRFLVGLLFVVAAGFLFPDPGAPGGLLRAEHTTKSAVVIVFLLQGLVLPFEALRSGLVNWRLHAFVQVFTYLVFPVVTAALLWLFGGGLSEELRVGFLLLGALPTTISTAVVFTSMAGGNAAGALVNVTVSNVIGVFLTPLWMSWFLKVQGQSVSVLPLIGQLALMILLPLAVGQVVRPFLRGFIDQHKHQANRINSLLVLFIVYSAFAGSVKSGVFIEHGWTAAGAAAAGSIVLFVVVQILATVAVRWLGLPGPDRIAGIFCGTQKTLGAGVPMAKLIFAGNPALGLLLLPIMIYHPVQLFVGGLLIHWLKKPAS